MRQMPLGAVPISAVKSYGNQRPAHRPAKALLVSSVSISELTCKKPAGRSWNACDATVDRTGCRRAAGCGRAELAHSACRLCGVEACLDVLDAHPAVPMAQSPHRVAQVCIARRCRHDVIGDANGVGHGCGKVGCTQKFGGVPACSWRQHPAALEQLPASPCAAKLARLSTAHAAAPAVRPHLRA